MSIYLCTVIYGCLHALTVKLKSCQRLFGLQSLKYDLILYIKKVCWLLVYDCCFVVIHSLSLVGLFVASWTVTHQASVHEISQARILEWVAISSSRGSSRPRD